METQMTFAEIEQSFIGLGKDTDNSIIVSNNAVELIRITPQGEVIAPTLEAASEAGKIFIEAIRSQLNKQQLELDGIDS